MKKRNSMGKLAVLIVIVFITGCSSQATVSQKPAAISGEAMEATMVDGVQQITLSWGRLNYAPEIMKLKQGVPAKIIADTTRLTGCYRVLEIPALKLEKHFSENDRVLEFTPAKAGTYPFGCAMGMGSGTLVVE